MLVAKQKVLIASNSKGGGLALRLSEGTNQRFISSGSFKLSNQAQIIVDMFLNIKTIRI